MEQISKLVFISYQKLLILLTYSVIATILLINSALYIIVFGSIFVLLGLVSGEVLMILNPSPETSTKQHKIEPKTITHYTKNYWDHLEYRVY